jgi:hypothetical protein
MKMAPSVMLHVRFSLTPANARRTDGLSRQVTLECLVANEYVRMMQWTLLTVERTW